MEKIKGFIEQKKNIRVLSMALAACAIVFVILVSTIKFDITESLPKFQLQMIALTYVFQLVLSGLLFGVCIYNILSKHDQDKFLYIVGGIAVVAAILLLMNYGLVSAIQAIVNEDFEEMGKSLVKLNSLNADFIKLAIYGNIGAGIYSGLLVYAAKSNPTAVNAATPVAIEAANIPAADTAATATTEASTETQVAATTAVATTPVTTDTVSNEAIVATLKTGLNKAKDLAIKLVAFLKTKKGLMTMAAIVAAIILLFVGKFIYGKMTMKEVDFTGKIELEFSGYNGEGSVSDPFNLDKSIEYDKTDKDLKNFVKTINFDISPDENLSNGDKVKLTAEFDEELAEELGIKPVNIEREYEVKGLEVLYTNVKEIPAKVVAEADKAAKKEVEDVKTTYFLDKNIYKETKFVSATPIAKYFTMFSDHPSSSGDCIQYVYKVKIEGLVDGKKETTDIYRFVEVNDVKSDLDGNNATIYSGDIYDNNFKEVKKDDEAISIFKKKLDDRNSYVEAFK
ncbi:MAG: hypothetical protein RSD85_02645 [Erysipelotrichaceae bacterium]